MENVRDAIASAVRNFTEAFERGDSAAVAAWYSRDATLLPPDSPMLKGADAIQTFWQGAMDMGVKEARLETLEVEERDDLAYEVGKFELTAQPQDGGSVKMKGKYVVVWKKEEGGGWKMHVDIWNGDAPA
jgi:uncharacterized protein (TIGR02246 family)